MGSLVRGAAAVLVPVVACMLGCGIAYLDIDVPESWPTDSTFGAIVDLGCSPQTGEEYGTFGLLLPEGWTVDSVACEGGLTGLLVWSGIYTALLADSFGEPAGRYWAGYLTDAPVGTQDSFTVHVLSAVHTGSEPGIWLLGFHAGWTLDPEDPSQYACSEPPQDGWEIETYVLEIATVTWGGVKAGFGDSWADEAPGCSNDR